MNNKFDEATNVYLNLDPRQTKLSLLELYLKSYIKRLPELAANELYRKYNFLRDENERLIGNEMQIESVEHIEEINEDSNESEKNVSNLKERKKNISVDGFGFSNCNSEKLNQSIKKQNEILKSERNEHQFRNFEQEDEEKSDIEYNNLIYPSKQNKYCFDFSSKVMKKPIKLNFIIKNS